MSQLTDIGVKIKELRNLKKLTLKQLSEKTNLSIGFLSQLERGMTTIAIDSLDAVSNVLGVELSSFFHPTELAGTDNITRSFDQEYTQISPQIIQYTLSQNVSQFGMLPRLFHLMPFMQRDESNAALYKHEGEEFIYVLEGVLTIDLEHHQHILYPGDSIQIHSNMQHNWKNKTNKVTKFLAVNIPNPFHKENTTSSTDAYF